MYLIDTNVISESRKANSANKGVANFFSNCQQEQTPVYLSVITIGELRRGVELIEYRGDSTQAKSLTSWLNIIIDEYRNYVLPVDADVSQLWGRLRVPNHENALDKLIAATALINDLILVTRNSKDFKNTSVRLLNPFD